MNTSEKRIICEVLRCDIDFYMPISEFADKLKEMHNEFSEKLWFDLELEISNYDLNLIGKRWETEEEVVKRLERDAIIVGMAKDEQKEYEEYLRLKKKFGE